MSIPHLAAAAPFRGAAAVVKNCEECGEALFNDIAYGFDPSLNLRNYVLEARQNYANCIAGISDACVNTCARQLDDNPPTCDSYDEDGFRACVETAHRGAKLSCP